MTIHWIEASLYDSEKHPLPIAGEDIEPHFWVRIGEDDRIYNWIDTTMFPAGFTPTGAKEGEPILVRHDKLPSNRSDWPFKCYLWQYDVSKSFRVRGTAE